MNKKLPAYISTGDPASFALNTITRRKPAIIDQVLEKHSLPPSISSRILLLKEEMKTGTVTDPFESCGFDQELFEKRELETWQTEIAKYTGRAWLDIPWYFAESYFYLRLLFAFGYYEPGSPNYRRDPFKPVKEQELLGPGGGKETVLRVLEIIGSLSEPADILNYLLHFSLWGNRMDLSNFQIARKSRERIYSKDTGNLLIDDSEILIDRLLAAGRVDVILDNAGHELVCDLLTATYLLSLPVKRQIRLHAKRSPFFVSDATGEDVEKTVQFLADLSGPGAAGTTGNDGRSLIKSLKEKRPVIEEHFFWNGPLHFPDLPEDLSESLSASELVLLKGDANYRRLLSDRKWKPWTPMDEITGYFPAPFAVLRTMKSEIVVDISREEVERLARVDPDWLINGERGIIRFAAQKT